MRHSERPLDTVGTESQLAASSQTVHSSSSRKSKSVRLEHNTVEPVVASCTYASAINASKISSVFVVYRRKTLTGSPDPTHANGTDKPCMCSLLLGEFLFALSGTGTTSFRGCTTT